MGFFRFRRSIRIAPGVRWNFGKKSTSFTVGPKGLKFTVGTRGTRTTVGLPGTGLSYTQAISTTNRHHRDDRLDDGHHSTSIETLPPAVQTVEPQDVGRRTAVPLIVVVLGLLLSAPAATFGVGVFLIWIGIGTGLRATAPVRWAGGGLLAVLLGVASMTVGNALTPIAAPPPALRLQPPTRPAPVSAIQPRRQMPPLVRTGRYQSFRYTYVEDKNGFGAFFFEPALTADDAVTIGAMRALLMQAYRINLRNAPAPRRVNALVRFVTGDDIYDCLAAKDKQNRVEAISVIRRD